MKKILVGYSGFVGSNLVMQTDFDGLFNSKNIESAFYSNPDICVYSGIRAEKYLANSNASEDLNTINNAIENIKRIKPKFLVLISTIDVYHETENRDEDFEISLTGNEAYGRNRLFLEKWVESNMDDYLIVRLPALFGINLKKNFIYDYVYRIPKMLNEHKFNELVSKAPELEVFYSKNSYGYFECKALNTDEIDSLKMILSNLSYSALNFTDSRNYFQFYNLQHLWEHIEIAIENNIRKINFVTEPVSAESIYRYLTNQEFANYILQEPLKYNLKTKYDTIYGSTNGYIYTKETVLKEIREFVRGLK